ncbi:MAG: hypothetical protein A2622_13450 [Bdellovibrionales bacterium RIFCSPHIGHO2_01_FULL_40_29]|nr:MAG: hypothetical protein A2622_13450 [Bdellovibrionales bacterium RIFCSPHIGHO2_01_FULL_40_29]OFZ34298.1 MAG: hypothetical protein A3D17_04500 [Bdellovibrionales bacterium RIFCSPHIGHO2_02_FULL_40_15]
MKKYFTCVLIAASLLGSTSHAVSEATLAKNYQTCMDNDPSWYSRWGYYLASFNRYEAWDICRGIWSGADIAMMGCRHNKKWLKAGYHCVW